jgi:mannose-1-phosphate guanylyltransferase
MNKNNYVVIMAGGIGSRFWPYSRTNFPKQFHDILGTGRSMLQETADRFDSICPPENIYIVTNKLYKDLVKDSLPFLSEHQILLEPEAKNTAPCVAYACNKISKLNAEAKIIVTPSDQFVLKLDQFVETINKGIDFASKENVLVTVGIVPTRPDTGYGYIQFDNSKSHTDTYKVKNFREKPNVETALAFINSGDYLWNSGLFIWSAQAIETAFAKYLPQMNEQFIRGKDVYGTDNEFEFIDELYPNCESISIDYGIMEKADNVYVIPGNYGWSDVGTWKSVYELSDKNQEGNVVSSNVLTYDTKDCIVKTPSHKLVVINGLEGYIVAEFDDVLMICKKDDEQKVKQFVSDVRKNFPEKFV